LREPDVHGVAGDRERRVHAAVAEPGVADDVEGVHLDRLGRDQVVAAVAQGQRQHDAEKPRHGPEHMRDSCVTVTQPVRSQATPRRVWNMVTGVTLPYELIRFIKFAGVLGFAGGAVGALVARDLETRRIAVHRVASPALVATGSAVTCSPMPSPARCPSCGWSPAWG
jgi:hypothetical protein